MDQVTYSVNPGSEDIQEALSDQPIKSHLRVQLFYAEDSDAVENGHNSAQAHSDEHESAERPPGRRSKLREQHDDGSRYTDARDLAVSRISLGQLSKPIRRNNSSRLEVEKIGTHHHPINSHHLHVTAESIKDRRDETAPDEQHNPVGKTINVSTAFLPQTPIARARNSTAQLNSPQIIRPIPPPRNPPRMVRQRMITRRNSQTRHGSDEKSRKHPHILRGRVCLEPRFDHGGVDI